MAERRSQELSTRLNCRETQPLLARWHGGVKASTGTLSTRAFENKAWKVAATCPDPRPPALALPLSMAWTVLLLHCPSPPCLRMLLYMEHGGVTQLWPELPCWTQGEGAGVSQDKGSRQSGCLMPVMAWVLFLLDRYSGSGNTPPALQARHHDCRTCFCGKLMAL